MGTKIIQGDCIEQMKGCGKKIKIGYNNVLGCPIIAQCGMSKDGNDIVLCDECVKRGNKE